MSYHPLAEYLSWRYQDSKKNGGIEIKVKISFGFLNEKPVSRYRGKVIIVSLLVDTSDGRIAHFARIRCVFFSPLVDLLLTYPRSGQMLGKGQDVVTKVLIMRPDQTIHCYAMCDEIGMFTNPLFSKEIL